MAFGNFRETNESKEANETKEMTENIDKPKNQILQTPEKNEDDFEKKMEASELKENKDSAKDIREGKEKREGEKQNVFERMKDWFANRDAKKENENVNEKNEEPRKQDAPAKSWELSPEELQKVKDGQSEVAQKARDGVYDKPKETSSGEDEETVESSQKTPWDDAQRRMEHER